MPTEIDEYRPEITIQPVATEGAEVPAAHRPADQRADTVLVSSPASRPSVAERRSQKRLAKAIAFYANGLSPEELADLEAYGADLDISHEVACARIALDRVLVAARRMDSSEMQSRLYARLLRLGLKATRTIGRLQREKKAQSKKDDDDTPAPLAYALDELSKGRAIDL